MEYGRLLSRHWYTLVVSGIFGIVGVAETIAGTQWAIPPWVWWVGMGVTLVGSQFWAFYSLYREKFHTPSKFSDMTFSELIARVTGLARSDIHKHSEQLKVFFNLLHKIRAYGAVGQIQVWGRRISQTTSSEAPRLIIPADYWETYGICDLKSLGERDGVTQLLLPSVYNEVYGDLAFCRHQVIPLLAKPIYKVKWVWPVRIERTYGS